MPETRSSASEKAGLPAGELVHVGEVHHAESSITLLDYDKDDLHVHHISSVRDLLPYKSSNTVSWVIIEGLADMALFRELGEVFDIHPLVLEDIVNTHQRPKMDEYEDYLYMVLKRLEVSDTEFAVEYEQLSLLLFDNMLFTFKEKRDDLFVTVMTRLRAEKGRLRTQSTDYLAYVVLDTIVDGYFALQDSLDAFTDDIEENLFERPGPELLNRIQQAKRELIFVRKSLSPLREMLAALERSDSTLLSEKTHIYLRDVYDHAIRVIESVDSYRDLITGMLEIYLSSVSNRLNEIMKVLTVFSTIFIPLTFITGIYGMNFQDMPELKWPWSYPILWLVFISIPAILLIYFRKRKWL
ncbi:MAG: magnesium/cobalt transporter CorA [Gammaproteobacteria bacterium]|nr:magnesium/cobalt transporter CorA [Gammaproteobacteria bacterium]